MYRRRATVELNKPFKPLVINRPPSSDGSDKRNLDSLDTKQELKKIKVETKIESSAGTPKPRGPLLPSQTFRSLKVNPITAPASTDPGTTPPGGSGQYFEALWRKSTQKKNKTWDGDGMIVIENKTSATLQNIDGKQITKARLKPCAIEEGELIKMGFYEVELGAPIPREKYLSGSFFLQQGPAGSESVLTTKVLNSAFITPNTLNPAVAATSGAIRRKVKIQGPRHNPEAEGAIVMPRPKSSTKGIVDVVVDPLLSQYLRPHQKEGVKFLYECVMGMRNYQGRGAILADEMGLGKTLMTITLIWTLLKQTPFMNEPPVIQRALIVCPVTLIANWKREFRKWLGNERIGVFTLDSRNKLSDFVSGRCYQVMIVGYEKLRSISADLKRASIDIIICDEGHRLKTATNKSAQAILELRTDRRVILSGTPIQNDLGEFYTMVDFLNPGILGTFSTFKREFEVPIMKSRQPEAMKKDIEKGTKRSEELSQLTRLFTLRRTAATLDKYLPPKTDTVLFCAPTDQQVMIYKDLIDSNMAKWCMGSIDPADTLRAITVLKKLCNSPTLIKDADFGNSKVKIPATLATTSGKMKVLLEFLKKLYADSEEKVVIVSGYTQTLDLIEEKLGELNLPSLRLDGSTLASKRQIMVDKFNNSNQKQSFVFLLSAKSGGTGLNLVGASRLFLYDTDWNPSVDLQAMARVHRDGQKRPVFIYRLLTSGTMDEKIYQRQITKQGLADTFMEGGAASGTTPGSSKQRLLSVTREIKPKGSGSSNTFSLSELQDLFTLHTGTKSNTHDLLGCKCQDPAGTQCTEGSQTAVRSASGVDDSADEENEGSLDSQDSQDSEGLGGWVTARNVAEGTVPVPRRLQNNKEKMRGIYEYKHIDPSIRSEDDEITTGDFMLDELLKEATSPVSFIFTKSTPESSEPMEAVEI